MRTENEVDIVIRDVRIEDQSRWGELFRNYREFYCLPADDSVVDTVWGWLLDPSHSVAGLVATTASGAVVGLAHHRLFARPSTGTTGIWLDDLFTDPAHRGRGIGRKLISELKGRAALNDCSVVRWITAADNVTAQHLYDQMADRTQWSVYDLTP